MSVLIEEFKREHSEIIENLNEVEGLSITTKEGQAKLMSLKATLLEHLKREDKKLYPVLWREAEQNKKLKEQLEVFAKDLESVSMLVSGFFDRYNKGALGAKPSRDFETLFTILRYRMRNEENFLYNEYEEMNKL